MRDIKPRYEVEALEGTVDHVIYEMEPHKNAKGKISHRLTQKTIKEPAGFMVYFPRGHSMRVRTEKDLRALGFDKPPLLQDMDNDELMAPITPTSLKQHVARSTKGRPRTPSVAATESVQAGGTE